MSIPGPAKRLPTPLGYMGVTEDDGSESFLIVDANMETVAQCPSVEVSMELATGYNDCHTAESERDRLRNAISKAGFAVMETSGDWSIHDVSEQGKAEEARSLEVATRNAELEAERDALLSERLDALAWMDTVDLGKGHIRDNADSDQLRRYLYMAGLELAKKDEQLSELKKIREQLATMEREIDAVSESTGRKIMSCEGGGPENKIGTLALSVAALKSDRDALAKFKAFVHRYLDGKGVPKEFPDGEHSKEGCRIGDPVGLCVCGARRV